MNGKARQRYHLDIKRKLSTQDPILEGAAQEEDSTRIINIEDWSLFQRVSAQKKQAA